MPCPGGRTLPQRCFPWKSALVHAFAVLVVLLSAVTGYAQTVGPSARDGALVLPTLVEALGAARVREAAAPGQTTRQATLARELDRILQEAVKDLGLQLQTEALPETAYRSELVLPRLATHRWVISPRLRVTEPLLELRILAVAPGSQVVLVRTAQAQESLLEVRAMVMVRDLVQTSRCQRSAEDPATPERRPGVLAEPAQSEGRAVLALNGAALGGYIGWSLQRASGSNDARLLYPLMALGSGVGLGATMIVAEEWDVGVGDAWFLSAGTWWPMASGVLLANAYRVEPVTDRYVYGLTGAAAGLTLAATTIAIRPIREGGAAMAHSGGAMGTLLGGLAYLVYKGDTEAFPSRGMGYGAAGGVLLAGALATRLEIPASRVLMIDLGAGLGALTGAAVAAPVLFVDDRSSKRRNRIWLASIAGGMLVGGTAAAWITRSDTARPSRSSVAFPFAGVMGESVGPRGRAFPVLGGGVAGTW
ncbi:MAG: hypothetical protein JW940_10565 [Polyangiaceae bacterium]|nr:hypothetical protein [Polyangiaceae bacterium]